MFYVKNAYLASKLQHYNTENEYLASKNKDDTSNWFTFYRDTYNSCNSCIMDTPTPSPAGECVAPPTLACGRGGGGVPIRTRGHTLGIYVLCAFPYPSSSVFVKLGLAWTAKICETCKYNARDSTVLKICQTHLQKIRETLKSVRAIFDVFSRHWSIQGEHMWNLPNLNTMTENTSRYRSLEWLDPRNVFIKIFSNQGPE
jgi:hypothetical protein